MAGYRRTRAAGQPLPPTLRRERLTNRRTRLTVRFAEAATARERLEIAYDYVRGAAARRQPNPARADEILAEATTALIAAGDQLLELQGREPLRPRPTEEQPS